MPNHETKLGDLTLEQTIRGAKWLLDWLFGIRNWNTPAGWCARVVIWIVVAYILVRIVAHVFEILAKLRESWTSFGFPVFASAEDRTSMRRRGQFCKALGSDLSTLAKAENWNDQWFTDLEAEVEAEGGYYATRLDRRLRRRSTGLRRVSSLVEAIEYSTEQCLLLVGEPGSGKSVALRHLAHQLAERGQRSSDLQAKVPLYVNLRELPPAPPSGPTADHIKRFVLQNVRRGDADTADYIQEHWDAYRQDGLWFFLFDSFDEIPAVLHAETGSPAIRQHAEAIRQFLEGMSACRGVLASREFKGPDSLPWHRLRILPLGQRKQEELVNNSFLSVSQKALVLLHLATGYSRLGDNPLFLTLMCRFAKQENCAPASDHDLLERHIERLARRDPEHTREHYGLQPSGLIAGASRLAVLFAESPALGLAPTQDEIALAWGAASVPGGNLEQLLSALVDVKIGRCDVREAHGGDRRFAFGHRRYQETLYVQYLSRNPHRIRPRELLTDPRWREYAVTLLQTQPRETIAPLLSDAADLLGGRARERTPTPILPGLAAGGGYYEWTDEVAVPLVELLQEGLGRRLQDVPEPLSMNLACLLDPPWDTGDIYDRTMVVRLAGLLPQPRLHAVLELAARTGVGPMPDVAFRQAVFLQEVSPPLRRWLGRALFMLVLAAPDRSSLLTLQALAARLPLSVRAASVFGDAAALRPLVVPLRLTDAVRHAARCISGPAGSWRRYGSDPFAFFLLDYIARSWLDLNTASLASFVTTMLTAIGLPVVAIAAVALVPLALVAARRRLRHLRESKPAHPALLLQAASALELDMWLCVDADELLPTRAHARSLSALLLHSSTVAPSPLASGLRQEGVGRAAASAHIQDLVLGMLRAPGSVPAGPDSESDS